MAAVLSFGRFRFVLFLALAGSGGTLGAVELRPEVGTFLDRYCTGCHNPTDRKGRLDLESVGFEADSRSNLALWIKIHDRVSAGEMPPKEKRRPDAALREEFTQALAATVTSVEEEAAAREGRTVQRRLNRYEYENAVRDLLHVPWAQVMNKLPQDGEAYRYNKSGEALDISHVQMARYLSAADYALREAVRQQFERPDNATRRFYARDEPSLRNFWPRENGTLPDRLSFPVLDSHAQPDVRAGRAPATSPETREREATGKVASTFSDAGGYSWSQFRAPIAGRYKLRFRGYTIWVGGGGIGRWFFEGQGAEKSPVYWQPAWHRPNLDEVWPGRRTEPIGVYAASSGQRRAVGAFDFRPEPTTHEIDVTLASGEIIQTDGSRLFRTRVNGTDEQYVNPLAQPDGMPGYAVQWLEVEGPLDHDDVAAGYRLLFDDLPLRRASAGERGVALGTVPPPPPPGQGSPFSRNIVRLVDVSAEVVSADAEADAARLLRRFMDRAYRRPVREEDLQRFLGLYREQFAQGSGFAKAMLAAYTAVLASPAFVFIEEQPGRLDDYALATRLALFLWNSVPDEALRARAARGELHRPEVLRAETERLLDDPRSRRFVDAFTDYWLDLRKVDDTSPSATLYNDYELDDPLKQAAIEETRLFVAELVSRDLPARNVVQSDFTFLNERLAAHYEVPGVSGAKLRRVDLPAGSVRGGLMTQAAILKVTANGTTTSPVLRGHWITERILGIETPPPPPVASVEPDIRGAVTIRQQLEKHRADASCASCHASMDPPGFALEGFDVMGGQRERYRAVKEDVTPATGVGLNGQRFAFHYALPVDAAGELPDGRPFHDVRELKQLLLADELPLARNIAKQLITYATGQPVRFSERAQLEAILGRASRHDYGVRSLVHEIIQSDLFQTK
jgi:hypothetical protein